MDLSKTHPRTFPCSTCKKHISNSPKHLCQQSSYSDVSPNHDSKESKYNAEEVESMPSKLTNFNFRQESHFKSTSKFVQEEREPNDRSVEFKGAKTQKDCVINISENNFSLYSSQQGSGQKARPYPYEIESNRDHILKADSKSGKSKRTTNLSNMKLKKDKPMRTKIKSEDFESEEVGSHLIKMDRISGEELKNEKSETEREESLKVKPDALRKVIEMKEDKKASYCSTGPNDLNCDLHYQKYLEVFQVEEKQLFPVGRQPHEIRAQDKIDDPDESDIAGGVLI